MLLGRPGLKAGDKPIMAYVLPDELSIGQPLIAKIPFSCPGYKTRQTASSTPSAVTRFYPPNANDTPETLYVIGYPPSRLCPPVPRFVRRSDPEELLIYTDGSCLENGRTSPSAGCAFVFRPASEKHPGDVHFKLERQGPDGIEHVHTSNRAELRAVIAALQFRVWCGEGFKRLVIATDSDYAVSGITHWVHTWVRNGWVTSKRTAVKNRDLWELLVQEVNFFHQEGLEVIFWHIPRQLNSQADRLAKQAAASPDDQVEYAKFSGVLV